MDTIALFDKGGGDFSKIAEKQATKLVAPEKVNVFSYPDNQTVENLNNYTHIICHLNGDNAKPSWLDLLKLDLTHVQVIIRVSSVGHGGMADSFSPPYRLEQNGPWIFHLLNPSGSLEGGDWKTLLEAFINWEDTSSLPPRLADIFSLNSEHKLALRLLCEAWILTKNSESDEDGAKVITENDIEIHCPPPKDWFSLLEIEDQSHFSAFGDLQDDVEEIIKAINEDKDLKTPIENYLKKMSTSESEQPNQEGVN